MKPRKKSSAPPRNRDLARIHILAGAQGLNLPRDVYEAVIWTQGRQHSSGKLDQQGREKVIAHLEGLLRAQNPKHPALRPARGEPRNLDAKGREELQKIRGLLADAKLPWSYAESILKNQTRGRVLKIEFADTAQLIGVVAALHRQALKRLHTQLEAALGPNWVPFTAHYASTLFGYRTRGLDVTRYPELMSHVLRWQHGELHPSCAWPLGSGACCGGCQGVAQFRRLADYHSRAAAIHSPDGEYPDGGSAANITA